MKRDSLSQQYAAFSQDSRGVSETLGYVLLISVVLLSIGSVALMGAPVIDDQQEAEYMSNTIRAFEVFSNNLDAIERDRAPARETEIRYQGGAIFQNEDFFMDISVTHDGETEQYLFAGTPVTYEKGDRSVHYEAGTVISDDQAGQVMHSDPSFKFTDERTRMSVITTTLKEDEQVLQGNGKMAIVAKATGSQTQAMTGGDSSDDVSVEIVVESHRYEAWASYFEQEGLTVNDVDHENNEVTVSFTTGEIALRETLITIDAQS